MAEEAAVPAPEQPEESSAAPEPSTAEPEGSAEAGAAVGEPTPAPAPPAAELVEPGLLAPPPAPPEAPGAKHPGPVFLAVVSLVVLVSDLATKYLAKSRLEGPEHGFERGVDVVKGFFSVILARNRGGAWGILQDQPASIRRPFFIGISLVAIAFIVSLYRRLAPQQVALKWGLPLVLGGALGNLVNRIQYNYVIDFLDFYATFGGQEHHWPTFNVADIAIVAGVILMAIDMFTVRPAPPPAAAAPSDGPAASGEQKP